MTSDTRPPGYRLPLPHLPLFIVDLLLGRRRSFLRDARLVMRANREHERHVESLEQVPAVGPFILVMNHFSRRGLRPYHCAMAVNVAVAERRTDAGAYIRWAFTSEYVGLRIGPIPVPQSFLRWLFRRVALVYGFVTLPRREERVMGRAAALRELRRTVRHTPVGLTPEGLLSSGRLVRPPEGSGLFLATISAGEIPLLPVGLWEDRGALHIRFGPPFHLTLERHLPRADQDRRASDAVMMAIGRLLPRPYWGAYEPQLLQESGDVSSATGPSRANSTGGGEASP